MMRDDRATDENCAVIDRHRAGSGNHKRCRRVEGGLPDLKSALFHTKPGSFVRSTWNKLNGLKLSRRQRAAELYVP